MTYINDVMRFVASAGVFFRACVLIVLAGTICLQSAIAQEDAAELAKKLSNPISSLISVPLQNNSDFGIGEYEGSRNTMNVQPVIPIGLSEKWSLITRVIVPVISQYSITGVGEKQTGLGDVVLSAFFSPAISKNGLTWGAGPVFLLPTGTDEALAARKFGIGPTAVILKQSGGWTIGGLANQIWSVGGDDPEISAMFLQPFLIYNWSSGAGVGMNFELTQNWKSSQTTLWFNPFVNAITSVGKQKIQLALGPRFNLAAPDGSKANWGVRAVLVFLFPKG